MNTPPPRRSINSVIPNLLTLTSCCAGLTAVRYALEGEAERALMFILAASVLDGLDGTVARWLKAASQFGCELDSLADFVAFGISPGLIVYYTVFADAPHVFSSVAWGTTLLFSMCCGLRLARFNVANLSPAEGKPEPFLRGIPAPGGGLLGLMPLALMQIVPELAQHPLSAPFYALWQVFIGLMMVSSIPTFSPKKLRVPQRFRIVFLLGMLCVLLLALELPWHTWVAICSLYLVSIPWLALKMRAQQKVT
ncbi:MAG: CDP-alcohol phosphatidyltransferase family protein [Alphaproteobacteria bacterium]|nr:CDP-alcohol phosphatidyltransferase family protein [Alphaproteobacteria bacterium]